MPKLLVASSETESKFFGDVQPGNGVMFIFVDENDEESKKVAFEVATYAESVPLLTVVSVHDNDYGRAMLCF